MAKNEPRAADLAPPSEVSGVVTYPACLAIERAKRGDPAALNDFFRRHERGLWTYFSGPRHWHWDLVPDLVQETMTRAVKAFDRFRGTTQAQAQRWLYGIARNVHLQEITRQVGIRLRKDVAKELAKQLPQWHERAWLRPDIADALAELPLAELEALRHTLEGLKIREISALLDVPEGTVATRIHRARKKLRTRLGSRVLDR